MPRRKTVKPVVGIDSETVTDANGKARLVLVAASDGTHIASQTRITTDQALSYILDRGAVELWTFFGDYDVNFWLADFPPKVLDRLRRTNWARCRGWRIHHIPRRCFEVWQTRNGTPIKGRYAIVYDAFPFVQSSFVDWLERWQITNKQTIQRIRNMKLQRGNFAKVDPSRILRYTQQEVTCIASGVELIKDRIRTAECAPSRWLGPGAVASVVLRQHAVKDYQPKKVHRYAERAYFGGRIETSIIGRWKRPVYYYDINSAYPAACIGLPCLKRGHGKWVYRHPKRNETALVKVRWHRPTSDNWGPFPVRTKKGFSLRYYAHGTGWYWWDEVRHWLRVKGGGLLILSAWTWQQKCAHKPVDWIADLYVKRQHLKQNNDPAEYALKLVLNSIYGKFAQRVGQHPYQCLEWAGLITARTRARIARDVLIPYGDDVLVVATDGVVTKRRIPALESDSKELGAWARAGVYEWADVWQPGFYMLSDGMIRTRGFTRRDVDPKRFRREWEKITNGDYAQTGPTAFGPGVPVRRKRVIGYRLATARGKPETMGTWIDDQSLVSFDPRPRRRVTKALSNGCWATGPPISESQDAERTNVAEVLQQIKRRRELDYLDDGEPLGFFRD